MLYTSRKYLHDKAGCEKLISDALYDLRFIYEKPDDEVSTVFTPYDVILIVLHADCVG
jgi:hypothetical protein